MAYSILKQEIKFQDINDFETLIFLKLLPQRLDYLQNSHFFLSCIIKHPSKKSFFLLKKSKK